VKPPETVRVVEAGVGFGAGVTGGFTGTPGFGTGLPPAAMGFGREGGAVGLGGAAIAIAALPTTIAAADFLRILRRDAADRLDFIFGLPRFIRRQDII